MARSVIRPSACRFLPPYLVAHVMEHLGDRLVLDAGSLSTLGLDAELRARRERFPSAPAETAAATGLATWTVHDADHGATLPGKLVRAAGDPTSGDAAVDEAYTGIEASLSLFAEVFGRSSYDGQGAPVTASVHFQRGYDNAFWDGSQLVFGDGDGQVFDRFTKPIDVLGHELTHAVTQYTAGLTYQGQSGALNESVSDVFAAMVKQRVLGQNVEQADWLIGAGLFLPGINGRALRDMAAPGTAYDDPALGKDPQGDTMAGYVETTDDNGGVHINSGIPNRAFQLVATGLGGHSWEVAGPIWYAVLTSGLSPDVDFAGFAAATLAAAESVAPDAVAVVREAWHTVGVVPAQSSPGAGADASSGGLAPGPGVVAVRRSGGFAGMVRTGQAILGDDPRTVEIEELLGGIDPAVLSFGPPEPDRFVYTFDLHGQQFTVPEQALTPELSRLAGLLLDHESW